MMRPQLVLNSLLVSCLLTSASSAEAQAPSSPDAGVAAPYVQVMAAPPEPGVRHRGIGGIRISFLAKAFETTARNTISVDAHVKTSDGKAVRAAVDSRAVSDGQGRLRVSTQISSIALRQRKSELFIPFWAMKLPPGAHDLTIELTARMKSNTTSARPSETPIEVRGKSVVGTRIQKPPTRSVQVLVSQVVASPIAADASFLRPRKARPDLFWRLLFDRVSVYSSPVCTDCRQAKWKRYSPVVQVSEGDLITVSILDRDVAKNDRLGSFVFTLETLQNIASSKVPLALSDVDSLLLGPVKLR